MHIHPHTVLEGDFLTRYFASIGDFSLFGGGNDFVSGLISNLRDNLEFDPRDGDEDDDNNDDEETTDGGFNIRGFLRNVTSQLEDRAIQRLTQSAEIGQCIRRVVEVISLSLSLSLVKLFHILFMIYTESHCTAENGSPS